MDYSEFEKLKKKNQDKKDSGLLKNSTQVNTKEIRSEADKMEEQVAIDNANKDLDVVGMKPQEPLKVISKTELGSEKNDLTKPLLTPSTSLTKGIEEKYLKNINKLFEKIDLNNYDGGLYTLDGEQYTHDDLLAIMKLLFGPTLKTSNLDVSGKALTFVKSLDERNLKRYVKNKIVFKFVNASFKWWNLSM